MMKMLQKLKIALIQLSVCEEKTTNLNRVKDFVQEAVNKGAQLIALPECFNSPYGNKYFRKYAESIPGETSELMSKLAKHHKIHLVAGSIPEKYENDYYNTCLVFDTDGKLLTKFRKIHLFDIDIPGKMQFKESETLKPGYNLSTFNISNIKFGLGICYDLRFPELALLYRKHGCHLLLYPSAFSYVTGPPHWELLLRARALDNQVYCAGVSSAADNNPAGHTTFGHSLVTDPWGKVIAKTDEKESILYSEIDMDYLEEVRQQMPLSNQKRGDLYSLEYYDVADPEAPFYSIP
ncbi:unnamed protein product [Gordionus sp. m RMFG-2023]